MVFYDKIARLVNTLENLKDSLPSNDPTQDINKLISRTLIEDNYSKGDHIFVQRFGYTHHGIYDGYGGVYHYILENVSWDSIESFANGMPIKVKQSKCKYDPSTIIDRARSRLWENEYNLVFNNCEHFAKWCRSGD